MSCTQEINASLDKAHEVLSASKESKINSLDFDWSDMKFSATSDSFGSNGGKIKLSAKIGRLYFTVENERLRTESIKIIHQNNRKIDGKFSLERDGSVTFASLTTLSTKVLGDDFVKAVTMIMLESREQFKTLRSYLKTP